MAEVGIVFGLKHPRYPTVKWLGGREEPRPSSRQFIVGSIDTGDQDRVK